MLLCVPLTLCSQLQAKTAAVVAAAGCACLAWLLQRREAGRGADVQLHGATHRHAPQDGSQPRLKSRAERLLPERSPLPSQRPRRASRTAPRRPATCPASQPRVLWVQNSESKKEEFRKYLERAGVIDALTKGAPPFAAPRCSRPSRACCVADAGVVRPRSVGGAVRDQREAGECPGVRPFPLRPLRWARLTPAVALPQLHQAVPECLQCGRGGALEVGVGVGEGRERCVAEGAG